MPAWKKVPGCQAIAPRSEYTTPRPYSQCPLNLAILGSHADTAGYLLAHDSGIIRSQLQELNINECDDDECGKEDKKWGSCFTRRCATWMMMNYARRLRKMKRGRLVEEDNE